MAITIKDKIIRIIKENACISAPITAKSNLYIDLGYDSLSFIILLTKIETAFSVTFDIAEMELCLQAGNLFLIVENKIKERSFG